MRRQKIIGREKQHECLQKVKTCLGFVEVWKGCYWGTLLSFVINLKLDGSFVKGEIWGFGVCKSVDISWHFLTSSPSHGRFTLRCWDRHPGF